MIRIGVDAWNLPGDRRGIGRYVRSILAAWAQTATDRVQVTLVVPERATWFAGARYRAELDGRPYRVRSRTSLRRRHFDAIWFPFNGPSWDDTFGGPAIATLHDASTFVLPGFDDAARATFRSAVTRCTHVITDSQFSADELVRELGIAPAAITAVPLGVATPRLEVAATIDLASFGRFVLYVGGTEPRKNLATVFAAMRRVVERDPDVQLVIVGPPTFALPPHDDIRVHALGHVDDDTLAALYRACSAFVYASAYEGFGLPILEAMSYGAPVVAARSSSLPEAGGDAPLYADTYDAAAFADALSRLLREPGVASDVRARGHARAASMTWARTAERTLAVFADVVAKAGV